MLSESLQENAMVTVNGVRTPRHNGKVTETEQGKYTFMQRFSIKEYILHSSDFVILCEKSRTAQCIRRVRAISHFSTKTSHTYVSIWFFR